MFRKMLIGAALPAAVLCASLSAWADDTASQAFIKKAIQGNLAEIAAGGLAQQKAAADEVKQYGQLLQTDHAAANEKAMTAAKTLSVDAPTEPDSAQKSAYQKLSGETGTAFDRDFVMMMVDDHKQAIALYQQESSANDAAGQYAKDALPTLQDHLAKAETLEKSLPVTTGSAPANPPSMAATAPAEPAPTQTASAETPQQGAPFPGANSFTEGQARSRIASAGFGNVSGLKQDDKGIWRGTANKDGKTVNVALDYKGNVVAQ